MPDGFRPLLDRSDVWIPLHAVVNPAQQNLRIMSSAGRLRPGGTIAEAQSELVPIAESLAREFPTGHASMAPQVVDLQELLMGSRRPALAALAASVLLLLILACANVLNLTLGHLATRRGELAVRAAIGAGRWRLARLHLVQTLLLSIAGGGAGLALTAWVLPIILASSARDGQPFVDAGIDWRVLAFGVASIASTALLSGVVPALRATRSSLDGSVTRLVSARSGGAWEGRLRGALVVVQVALAVILLGGAGAFLTSLGRLLGTSPAFSPDGVLSLQLMLPPARYSDAPARATFVRQMVERVSAVPGVAAAGTTQTTFLPNQSMQTGLWIDGRPIDAEHTETAHIRHITPGYFTALRVPVMDGRAIDDRDQLGQAPVCMVSVRFAKQYWPNESALGHRVRRLSSGAPWLTIVGVAADVMDAGLGVAQGPTLYVPYLQQNTPTARVSLIVRTSGDALAIAAGVRQAIWSVDPLQSIDRVERLRDLLADSAGDQYFRTALASAFALAGLALALVGIYGVTAAAVKSRTWEAGVKLALGASPFGMVSGMLVEAGRHVLIGAAVGIAGYVAIGRLATSLLYNTSATEFQVVSLAVTPLAAASLLVSYLQARRLASVSPVSALREGGR